MFHAAPPRTFVAFSSKRSGKRRGTNGKAYVHPRNVLPSERRCDFVQVVQAAIDSGDESVYTTLAVFSPSVCAFPDRDQHYSFTGGRCTHFLGICIDLDIGRSEEDAGGVSQLISSGEALLSVFRLVEKGEIPLPTMTAESGRGRYVIFIFATAVAHSPEVRRLRKVVIDELLVRLIGLAPDRSSGYLTQLFKVPGSPSVIGPVRYAMFERGDITAPLYSLDYLAELLGVRNQSASEPRPVRPIPRRRKPNKSPLQHVAWARARMKELQRLVPLRRRWRGFRHHLLLAFAEAARWWFRAGHVFEPEQLAIDEIFRFNASLPDPEDEGTIQTEILGSRLCRRPQRSETVARNLAITIEETHRARLLSLAHPDIIREKQEAKRLRAEKKDRRRTEVDARLLSGEPVLVIARNTGLSSATIYRRRKKLRA